MHKRSGIAALTINARVRPRNVTVKRERERERERDARARSPIRQLTQPILLGMCPLHEITRMCYYYTCMCYILLCI